MFVALLLSVAAVRADAFDDRDTCEILATVAKEHFGLDKTSGPPLQESGGYLPRCDWTSLGLKPFATVPQYQVARTMMRRPEIQGRKAKVEVGILWMSRWGHGSVCSLTKRGRHWRLDECRIRWSS